MEDSAAESPQARRGSFRSHSAVLPNSNTGVLVVKPFRRLARSRVVRVSFPSVSSDAADELLGAGDRLVQASVDDATGRRLGISFKCKMSVNFSKNTLRWTRAGLRTRLHGVRNYTEYFLADVTHVSPTCGQASEQDEPLPEGAPVRLVDRLAAKLPDARRPLQHGFTGRQWRTFRVGVRAVAGPSQELQFVASTREKMKLWVAGLQRACEALQAQKPVPTSLMATDDALDREFHVADDNEDGELDSKEVARILKKVNLTSSRVEAQAMLCSVDTDASGTLDRTEFRALLTRHAMSQAHREFFRGLCEAEEAQPDLGAAEGSVSLSAQGLTQFLQGVQGDNVTEDQVAHYLEQLPLTHVCDGRLVEHGFWSLITGPNFDGVGPSASEVSQDMSRPLHDYWIASSHNTYLEGHQLTGHASVEQYMAVLLRGCRCVEIDIWDGPGDEPVVTHGHTLTSKVLLMDVVRVIREYAFVASPYPLILSLEQHCGPRGIARCAAIFYQTLRSVLWLPDDSVNIPTPEESRGRIFIKAKLHKTDVAEWEEAFSDDEEDDEDGEAEKKGTTLLLQQGESRANLESNQKQKCCCVVAKTPVTDEHIHFYNAMVFFPGGKFAAKGFANQGTTALCSFNEKQVEKWQPAEMSAYHRSTISRVYPHLMRVDSSNYSPSAAWLFGAQLVALNYQQFDAGSIENEGRFRQANGGCGMVLKPPCVDSGVAAAKVGKQFGRARTNVPQDATEALLQVNLKVLALHRVPKGEGLGLEAPSLCVRVRTHGAASDCFAGEVVATAKKGLTLACDGEFSLCFSLPDVAVLSLQVCQREYSTPLCAAALPVPALRPGLRWLPLFDSRFRDLDGAAVMLQVTSRWRPTSRDFWQPLVRAWEQRPRRGETTGRDEESVNPAPMSLLKELDSAGHGGFYSKSAAGWGGFDPKPRLGSNSSAIIQACPPSPTGPTDLPAALAGVSESDQGPRSRGARGGFQPMGTRRIQQINEKSSPDAVQGTLAQLFRAYSTSSNGPSCCGSPAEQQEFVADVVASDGLMQKQLCQEV